MKSAYPFFLIGSLCFSCTTPEEPEYPNILIILADDMGYQDPGYMGGMAQTPNLDSLSREGIMFTRFYSGAPNCSPSRVALLTAKIPSRAGMYNYRDVNSSMHLRKEEYILPEMLKAAGYQTTIMGKWHLGALGPGSKFDHPQPPEHGFDYFFATENNAMPSHLNPVNFIRNGAEAGEVEGYSCQILADELIQWFSKEYDPTRPFFHYIAFHEPHKKIASPPELIKNYPGLGNEDAEYMANLENLDKAIGRIISYLKENDLADNTLIFFTSDNGPWREGSQGNLRGKKSFVWEGGIRVPAILAWPEGNLKNRKVDEPAWIGDIYPTISSILGKEDKEDIDGQNLLPLLKGDAFDREKPLLWFFYRTYPELAYRKGNYNMVAFSNDTLRHTHFFTRRDMDFLGDIEFVDYELYDLELDPNQTRDISAEHPELFEEMKNELLLRFGSIRKDFPYWDDIQPFDTTGTTTRAKDLRK